MQECDVQSGLLAGLTRALRREALWEMWFSIKVVEKLITNWFNSLQYLILLPFYVLGRQI